MDFFGIGIDIVEIERIRGSLEDFGEKFIQRLFTAEEQVYCESHRQPALHYAARFAAKEAVSKALGTGIGKEVAFTEIEVIKKPSGEPQVELSGKAAEFAQKNGISCIKISLTHTEHYAAANAVALGSRNL